MKAPRKGARRRRALQADRTAGTETLWERMGHDEFEGPRKLQSGWNGKSQGEDVCDTETKLAAQVL